MMDQSIPVFPPCPDFVNFVTIFRIVVLTWNRWRNTTKIISLKPVTNISLKIARIAINTILLQARLPPKTAEFT